MPLRVVHKVGPPRFISAIDFIYLFIGLTLSPHEKVVGPIIAYLPSVLLNPSLSLFSNFFFFFLCWVHENLWEICTNM